MDTFRGRDWLFNHIFDNYLIFNQTLTNNILFITGSIGSGKSFICRELVHPTYVNNVNRSIKTTIKNQVIINHDFSKQQNLNLSQIEFFKFRLNKSILNKFNLNNDNISLFDSFDLLNNNPNNNYLIIIDSIESLLTDEYIYDFINLVKDIRIPSFFKFIISCRSDHFNSILKPKLNQLKFEQISLNKNFSITDSSRFNQNLSNDVILLISNIFSKNKLFYDQYHDQIRRLCYDLLNKSNSNLLFVSRVVHLIAKGRINLNDLDKLPNNIHKFYLYMIDKIHNQSSTIDFDFDIVKSIFGLFQFDINRSYSCYQLFKIISSKYTDMDEKKFNQFFNIFKDLFLIPVDNDNSSSNYSISNLEDQLSNVSYRLFHSSFYEYIIDLELCTNSYLCDQNKINELLTIYYWSKLCNFDCHMSRTSTPLVDLNKLDVAFNLGSSENGIDNSTDIRYIDDTSSSNKFNSKHEIHLKYLNKFRLHLSKVQQTNELNSKLKYHCDYHSSHHFKSSTNLCNIDNNFDDSSSMFESFKSKSPAKFSISSQILSQLFPLTDTFNNGDDSPTKLVRKSNKKIRFEENKNKNSSTSLSLSKNKNKCLNRICNFLLLFFCCK
jgi:hypothetical protein